MFYQDINQSSSSQSKRVSYSIFSTKREISVNNQGQMPSSDKNINVLRGCIQKVLNNKKNKNVQENMRIIKNKDAFEGFADNVKVSTHQCFSFLNEALQNARTLSYLNISGINLDPILAIELGQGIQKNTSLKEINLSGCQLNSTSLQYIFYSISNHQTIQSINLFNNQDFNIDLVNDINQFLFKGKNNLKQLKLAHCNIPSTAFSILLRNLKNSKSINYLDISMMEFSADALTSLGIALQHYKGKNYLEHLNLGYSSIKNQGLEILVQGVQWSFRKINIKELILKKIGINQEGVEHLEKFLKEISSLQKLDLSYNQIEEINCQNLLQRYFYEINLSSNLFSIFQPNFFLNALVVNLSGNRIELQGAFQIASILRQNPLWIELNLSNNQLKSEGFNSLIFGLRDNRMLKKLIVANNNLDGEALFIYMINHEQVYFEHLDISYNSIRYILVLFVLKFLKGGQLKYFRCQNLQQEKFFGDKTANSQIQVNSNYFGEMGSNLQQIQQNPFQLSTFNLRNLDFSNNPYIFTSVITSLATYYNKIEVLNLSSCKPVNESDIEQVCVMLKKSNTIHDLNLSNLDLGYKHSESLTKLRNAILLSSLKSLDLSRNQLFKSAPKIVIKNAAILNYKLENINYSYNGFDIKQVIFLETILSCFKNLYELNLSYNRFDFQALIVILQFLRKNHCLKYLDLSNQNLSSDDLLILSSIINAEKLQSLNLSNNRSLNKSKAFFNLCSSQKLKYLHLNQINFDEAYLNYTQKIIQRQRKNLNGIIIDYCNFQSNNYEKLAFYFTKIQNLQLLSVIYNPFIHQDLEKTAKFLIYFKSLKILQFQQVVFTENCTNQFAQWLQTDSCILEVIDLRECILTQNVFDSICSGVATNKTVQNLLLTKCSLGKLNFTNFAYAITSNKNLQIVKIDNNEITNNFANLSKGFNYKQTNIFLREFNLSDNNFTEASLIDLFFNKQLCVKELNISNCNLNLNLAYNFENVEFFYQIKSLNLSKNKLCDCVSQNLQKLLEQFYSLEELYLQDNQFSNNCMIQILKKVFQIKSMKLLDIRNNKINEKLILNLDDLINPNFQLQFLRLRLINLSVRGIKALTNILKKQESNQLFIDNIWSNIDDDDANIILQQYAKIGQKFRLNQSTLPDFLKEIIMHKSSLTDKFCELFGKYYPHLNFIELVDISDNPYISMYGKAYLFFYLFDQSYEMHQLKVMYINDSKEIRKLFDDGLFRYLLLRFINFLLQNNSKKILSSNEEVLKYSEINKVQGGMFGAWIIHKINKLLFYLDLIEPPAFLVSTLFIGKFRRNNKTIKILTIFFWIQFMVVNTIQFHTLIFIDYEKLFQCELNKVKFNICDDDSLPSIENEIIFTFFCILSIILIELAQLIFIVKLRRKIQPALQIVHPKIIQQLHSRFPSKRELGLMIFSIFRKYSTLPERNFLPMLLRINHTDQDIFNFQILFSIIIVFRALDQILLSIYNLVQFLKITPQQDQARYLSLLQRNFHSMNYFIPSDILTSLCPVQGYQFNKEIKINYEILIESYRVILFDFFLLILMGQFIYHSQLKFYITFNDKQPDFNIQIVFILMACFISIITSIFKILTTQPSVIKQNGFNQALIIKRYQYNKSQFVKPSDLKIEETINQMINRSQKKRDQYLQNLKEIEKGDSVTFESNQQKKSSVKDFVIQEESQNIETFRIEQQDSTQKPMVSAQTKFKFSQ